MKKTILVLTTAVFLTSCLKDKDYENGDIGHQVPDGKVIELVRPNSTTTVRSLALDFQNLDTIINVLPARIASASPAASNVTVTLDTTVTSAYLVSNPSLKHFKTMGGAIVSPLNLTIPAGSVETEPIQIRINTSNFDPSSQYVIGFKIASVSDPNYVINRNYNTYFLLLSAKNKYDGLYELTLTSSGWAAFGIGSGVTDVFPPDIELLTVSGNAVTLFQRAPSPFGNLQPGWAGGTGTISGYTSFGATTPKYTFNLANDKVIDVDNTTPDDGRGRDLVLDPLSTTSQFNPADRSIKIEYYMKQTGRPDQRFVTVFRYLGPR